VEETYDLSQRVAGVIGASIDEPNVKAQMSNFEAKVKAEVEVKV
jgi:hypothetical protein